MFVRKLLDVFAVQVAARLVEPLAERLEPIVAASVDRHLAREDAPDTLRSSGISAIDAPLTQRSSGVRRPIKVEVIP